MRDLTTRQKLFVAEYLTCYNATQAARLAGYSVATANRAGTVLLSNAVIREAIAAHLAGRTATVDVLLERLTALALADLGPYVDSAGNVDVDAIRAAGKGYMIDEVSSHRHPSGRVTVTVRLADRLGAIDKLLKAHGAYRDAGNSRTVNVHLHGPDVRHRDWDNAQLPPAQLTDGIPGVWSIVEGDNVADTSNNNIGAIEVDNE